MLLHLSGIEEKIIETDYFDIWEIVTDWSPEIRYFRQSVDSQQAIEMLDATKALLRLL